MVTIKYYMLEVRETQYNFVNSCTCSFPFLQSLKTSVNGSICAVDKRLAKQDDIRKKKASPYSAFLYSGGKSFLFNPIMQNDIHEHHLRDYFHVCHLGHVPAPSRGSPAVMDNQTPVVRPGIRDHSNPRHLTPEILESVATMKEGRRLPLSDLTK